MELRATRCQTLAAFVAWTDIQSLLSRIRVRCRFHAALGYRDALLKSNTLRQWRVAFLKNCDHPIHDIVPRHSHRKLDLSLCILLPVPAAMFAVVEYFEGSIVFCDA